MRLCIIFLFLIFSSRLYSQDLLADFNEQRNGWNTAAMDSCLRRALANGIDFSKADSVKMVIWITSDIVVFPEVILFNSRDTVAMNGHKWYVSGKSRRSGLQLDPSRKFTLKLLGENRISELRALAAKRPYTFDVPTALLVTAVKDRGKFVFKTYQPVELSTSGP